MLVLAFLRASGRALRRLLWKPAEKPTFFAIEYTDDAGPILRALTPEARAWAEKFLAESRLPNGDYFVSRAIVGGVVAGANERGYRVRIGRLD